MLNNLNKGKESKVRKHTDFLLKNDRFKKGKEKILLGDDYLGRYRHLRFPKIDQRERMTS